MTTIHRNSYIIKQSDGTEWKFSFKKDDGIIYNIFKENAWSESYTFNKDAFENFSVNLLPDDSIKVLYQDFDKTIMLGKYNGRQWDKQGILTNKKNETFSIFFKTASVGNNIYIVFSVFNKESNTASLFFQVLDQQNNLSNPKVIDTIKYNYEVPFTLYLADNKQLFIIYQRFLDNHEIGYKLLINDNKELSNFKLIDASKFPFKDYSAIVFDKILHALYIKKEEDFDSVNYVQVNPFKLNSNKLFKGANIGSCLISIIYGQIFYFWINDNKTYSSFSVDNGNSFTPIPYEQNLSSSDVFKSIYISKETDERNGLLCNEIYFIDDEVLQYLIFSNLYPYTKTDDCLWYIKYYMMNIRSTILQYQKDLNQNKQLIGALRSKLEQPDMTKLRYEEEFKSKINYTDLNNQLNQDIDTLQKSLIDKAEKLKSLENLNNEKEEKICVLKEEFTQNMTLLQEKLNDKEKEIKSLQNAKKGNNEEMLLLQENLYKKENEINVLKEKISQSEKIILRLANKIGNLNRIVKNMHNIR